MRTAGVRANGNVGLQRGSSLADRQLAADALRRQSMDQLQSDDLQVRLNAQFNLQQLDRGVIPGGGPGMGTRIDNGAQVSTSMAMMTGNVGNVGGNVGWGGTNKVGDGGGWAPK